MNNMHKYTNDAMRTASPESIFQQQVKPSEKALAAMEEWRDKEAESEMEAEWCDAVIHAMKQAKKEDWER